MNPKFIQRFEHWARHLAGDSFLQLYQTLAIGSFLLVGGVYLGYVDILWWQILLVLTTVVSLDYYLRVTLDQKSGFPFSAVNSAIGICLFLRTEWWPILFFAAIVAIASKYLFRSGDKHFFNPSYSAIFLVIAIFGNEAYVNHFQWGFEWYTLLPILFLGVFVTWRAGLWDSVLAFWISLLVCLTLFVDYTVEDFTWLFLTGSFLIMSFHGFTDPATMPTQRRYRLLFGAQIAILFFICRQIINEGYSFFAAYFLVNLFEMGFWQLEGKQWRGYDLRLLVQGGVTALLFLILFTMSFIYYLETSGFWPELLTNRCVQLICQWGIIRSWDVDSGL
jgi:hypothetical protein